MKGDRLIELISKEVLKHIRSIKKILVLGSEKDFNEFETKYLKDELVYPVFLSEHTKGEPMDQYEFIVVPVLSSIELAQIALGIGTTPRSELIVEALFNNKKIYLSESGIEYRKYRESSNPSFYKMFEVYEGKLREFGVKILRDDKNIITKVEEILTVEDKEEKRPINREVFLDKRLITERDMANALKGDMKNIKIGKNSILTPLAKDYIKINKVGVMRL